MRATRGTAGLFAFLCALASTGRAEGERRALFHWERAGGAESCISGEELARDVESHVGRPLFVTSGSADVRASGRVSRTEDGRSGGWRATIEVSRRDGGAGSNRVVAVEGKDCRALDEALVLVLAVAVEPLLPRDAPATGEGAPAAPSEAGAPENASAEKAQPVAPPTPKPESAAVPAVPVAEPEFRDAPAGGKPPRGASRFRLGASAVVAAGLMPGAAAGFGTSVAWVAPFRVSFELGWLGFPFGQSPTNAGRGDYRSLMGEARACPAIVDAPVFIDACATFFAGELRARGAGFAVRDLSASRPYVAWGVALRARIELTDPVFLRLGLEAMLPVTRDRFVIEAEGRTVELHRVAAVVGVAGVDAGVSF